MKFDWFICLTLTEPEVMIMYLYRECLLINMKKILIVSILFLLLIVGIGIYVYNGLRPSDIVNKEIPSYFLYKDKSESIPPEDHFISAPGDHKSPFYYQDGFLYCTSSKIKAVKVDYYSHSPGKFISGGWSFRYALVCGKQYFIVEGNDSNVNEGMLEGKLGISIYGPYQIPASLT